MSPHYRLRGGTRAAFTRRVPLIAVTAVITTTLLTTAVHPSDLANRKADPKAYSTEVAPGAPNETYAEAKTRGADLSAFGPDCDPATGRLAFPVASSPPCLRPFTGSNGGPTGQGVTADEIVVARYLPPPTDVISALAPAVISPSDTERTIQAFIELLADVFETYGRHLRVVNVAASGRENDPEAATADAVKVAAEIGAFASVGGPKLTTSYARELARRGVICIGCALVLPDDRIQENAPMLWNTEPTPDQYLRFAFTLADRLSGKPASLSTDAAMRKRTRRFGVIHIELSPPVFEGVAADYKRNASRFGLGPKLPVSSYLLDLSDLSTLAPQARTAISRMKNEGVTTIIFLGDPIVPSMLASAATQAKYFPEWITTGTLFVDTTSAARRIDQRQWSASIGVSFRPMPADPTNRGWNRVFEWYYGQAPPDPRVASEMSPLLLIFLGIHLAGPDLTPASFRDGLFRAPPTISSPTEPKVSFGDNKVVRAVDGTPRVDFGTVDDAALIWWDPDANGLDELGTEGNGAYRYIDGGARFEPGSIPSDVFERRDTDDPMMAPPIETAATIAIPITPHNLAALGGSQP